jgi:hypothetical protein
MADTGKKGTRKSRSGNGKVAAKTGPLKMGDVRCNNLSYRFKVALEKFNIDALKRTTHADEKTNRQFIVCNTRDRETADYHAHFDWRIREKQKEVAIEIHYVASAVTSKPGEQEPFAENVMPWLGQFFKHEDANAKIHSDFDFDVKRASLSWFPLPLRTKIANLGGEAIIDGIAVALPSQPDLVSRFFLSQIGSSVFVGIESERRIEFAKFSLARELQVERAFADKLIEVKP